MSLDLTDAEQLTILKNRKTPRPKIYRLGLGYVEISLEFEEFIILSSKDARTAVATWVNLANQTLSGPISRNDVYNSEILPNLDSDNKNRTTLSKQLLTPYENMKKGLDTDRFASLTDVQQMFNDLSITTKGLTTFAEYTNHQNSIISIEGSKKLLEFDVAHINQMLRSYVSVLLAYK